MLQYCKQDRRMRTCAHTHTHTHIYTYTHTHTHTHTLYLYTCIHICIYAYKLEKLIKMTAGHEISHKRLIIHISTLSYVIKLTLILLTWRIWLALMEWLRHSTTSRRVPGSIPGHWEFFSGHQTVPCALGLTQPLKMSTRIFLGVKTDGA
jgi:hypothetical protein